MPKRADAWCNINGSPACNALLSPCPWYCHFYNAWQEFYSPDCPDVPTCVQGFCLITVPDYSTGYCMRVVDEFSSFVFETTQAPQTGDVIEAPSTWVPFTASFRGGIPGAERVFRRVYRSSNGSDRVDSGPAADDLRMVYIRNTQRKTYYARCGWEKPGGTIYWGTGPDATGGRRLAARADANSPRSTRPADC